MPSRRSFLRVVGLTAAGGFAGCTWFDRGAEGYVQVKSISGIYSDGGRRYEESVLMVTLSSPPGEELPQLNYANDEWEDQFDALREPVVPDALHRDLRLAYDEVRYSVGVCSPSWGEQSWSEGCINDTTTRETFNRVQVHDRVRASSDETGLTIHSTDGRWQFDSA